MSQAPTDYQNIAARLQSARSTKELIEAAQSIQSIGENWERERLAKTFKRCYDQLKTSK